ncbi:putative acetyl-CoA acetyltransferase, cytosolic 2 [Smittium culicis]|uniref:acetyl-CoA C-acetyltransferase n=1 Tax=Smittium culicis TaxID=133412 RepID=A0A1R1Y339_9FUNG|nr:putative acetyl-CoA acetyltransferase, cytosolic 2 [Smittium culicis]
MQEFKQNGAYIVSYARTPIGAFNGVLASFSATELGTVALKGALEKSGIPATEVESIFFGNVVSANLGQNPARQVAINAGCKVDKVIGTNVNKVCASGMKALMLASQEIRLGESDVVAVVGSESMSNIPFYNTSSRFGGKFGNQTLADGIIKDGLLDAYNGELMGYAAEKCAAEYSINREIQDEFAVMSYERAISASSSNKFDSEIVGVPVIKRRGPTKTETLINKDEEITKFEKSRLLGLRPAFVDASGHGTVTAGNASSLSDGAASLIVVSGRYLTKLLQTNPAKLSSVFYVASSADAEQEPVLFTTSPALAIPKALSKVENLGFNPASSKVGEFVDYVEINEAFSVVGSANIKLMGLDINQVNVHGGAVALGHPLGCSGARIIVSLCNILQLNKATRGVAGVCNGGGGASAVVVEQVLL